MTSEQTTQEQLSSTDSYTPAHTSDHARPDAVRAHAFRHPGQILLAARMEIQSRPRVRGTRIHIFETSGLTRSILGAEYTPALRSFELIRGDLAEECGNDKVTVPTLKTAQGEYITDSWAIAEHVSAMCSHDTACDPRETSVGDLLGAIADASSKRRTARRARRSFPAEQPAKVSSSSLTRG